MLSVEFHYIGVLAIIAVLTLHGNVSFIPENFRFEIFVVMYFFAVLLLIRKFNFFNTVAIATPYILMKLLDLIVDNIPHQYLHLFYILSGSVFTLITLAFSIVLFRINMRYATVLFIISCGMLYYTITHIVTSYDVETLSPGGPEDNSDRLSENETCQHKCGYDSICLAACLDRCKHSYCITYGKRIPLDISNCAEHQRKYEASGLSTDPAALLCREMHKHHGKCVVCENSVCKEESKCHSTLIHDLNSKLNSKNKRFTDWHMTTPELKREWQKHKL